MRREIGGSSTVLTKRHNRGATPKRWRFRVSVAAVGGLIVALMTVGTPNGSFASTPTGTSPVPQGLNPALDPSVTPNGQTASATPMTVGFVLKARNLAPLEQKVARGWQGPYLTTAQFAAQFGQTPQIVNELEAYLRFFGISSTAYADDLDVTAIGTAGQFNKALAILLENYTLPGNGGSRRRAQHFYASKNDPRLPNQLSTSILSILGLSNYAPFASQAVKAKATPKVSGSISGAIPVGELTPQDFVSHYDLSSVESKGAMGQGQTIGILTLASLDPTVPTTFWNMLGLHTPSNRITLDNIDGGAGPVSLDAGSDESTLDVEQSGAIAPQSKILVYQAPNTDNGIVDTFYAAASDNIAGSVSLSWGESDTYALVSEANGIQSPSFAQAFDEAELEFAAQGQSSFASSGDYGAYEAAADTGTTNLSTLLPSDSAFITSTGGTTLPGTQTYAVLDQAGNPTAVTQSVTIPEEIGWNWNYLWPLFATQGFSSEAEAATSTTFYDLGGGGGGYSIFEPEPSYQQGVSGVSRFSHLNYLIPTDVTDAQGVPLPTQFAFNPSSIVTTGISPGGRATPDLSFDADPDTGYALYDPQFEPVYGTDFLKYGGTSFVAPQLNGATAVLASSIGHRLGFWNPVIYAAAQSRHSPFNPLSENQVYGSSYFSQTNADGTTSPLSGSFSSNNVYYTGTPGTIYNPSTGLGYADLGALRAFFAQ
jgi:kumamolisin